MKKFNINIPVPAFMDKDYLITDFGAKCEAGFKNTDAINAAISKCSSEGGGRVIIPRGIWFTGPVYLKSNVNLHLEDGSVLLFSSDVNDYPLIDTSFEGFFTYRCLSPIYSKEESNIAITGSGVIDGNGGDWRPLKKFKLTEKVWKGLLEKGGVVQEGKELVWWPTQQAYEGNQVLVSNPELYRDKEQCEKYKDFLRPVLLNFTRCKCVLLDGVTFQNSPAWCLHPWLCENVTIQNVSVRNPWFSQNGDGLDVDSCKYVKVYNCTFDVGDDAMCVKSGKNQDGRSLGKPCEYVIFDNCVVYHGHGGFVVGSEMSGGVRNISVTNCTFMGTDTGLRFKSCIGRGGLVENIYIENIDMTDIPKEAIIFTMGYDMDTKEGQVVSDEEIPEFRKISIKNIKCFNAGTPIHISGLKQMPVHDIELSDITICSKGEIFTNNAEGIIKNNVNIIG